MVAAVFSFYWWHLSSGKPEALPFITIYFVFFFLLFTFEFGSRNCMLMIVGLVHEGKLLVSTLKNPFNQIITNTCFSVIFF